MAKQGGMGDALYIDEFDVSGDIASLGRISGSMTVQDITDITKSAVARLGLIHDGGIDLTALWNPTEAGTLNSEHDVLKGRPVTDRYISYFRSTVLGAPAASLISKQVNYDANRNNDGSLLFNTSAESNGYGLAWGNNLTAGKQTDTVAANGGTVDLGSSPTSFSFGWAAYLHVFAFTGTSVTVTLQDSANGSTWANLSGGAFTAATAAGKQRLASSSSTATVRRFMRVVTSGTFSNAVFAVNFIRYEATGHP
jgi:hypothetical protein